MSESGLSIGWTELQQEVAFYLGYGRDLDADSFTADKTSFVESIVQSGVRRVYFPPAVSVPVSDRKAETIVGHRWSFLRKDATLNFAEDDFDITLPDDFSQIIGKLHYASGSGYADIPIIDAADVLSMLADSATTGQPKYAAVRPIDSDGSSGQRYELITFPIADDSYTVTYEYQVLTYALSDDAPYPLGGMALSELYIASCLAVAEERTSDANARLSRFTNLLIDAINRDKQLIAERTQPYDAVDSTWGYQYLRQRVGAALNYGTVASKWTDAQDNEIDSYVQSGIRRVYYPASPIVQNAGYSWSFMRPTAELEIEDGTSEYDLPSAFGRLIGRLYFSEDERYAPIQIIGIGDMRNLWSREETTGPPRYAAIEFKDHTGTTRQGQRIKFWPDVDSSYTLYYTYEADASALTTAKPYPLGGKELSELYVESCLALVEQNKQGVGVHTQQFQLMLADAIARDRKRGAKVFGRMGGTREISGEWNRAEGYPATIEYNDVEID